MLGRDTAVAFTRARPEPDGAGQLMVHAFEDQDASLHSIFALNNALIRLLPGGYRCWYF